MATLKSINPYTKELNAEFETLNEDQIDAVIDTAHEAYLTWKDTSFEERRELFHKLADVLEADIDEASRLQTIEMGMLYSDSKAWMYKTAELIRWFADNAEKVLGEKALNIEGFQGIEKYDSLWVIFGIAPWNFPFNQLLRAAVPNILAGNTQIYKHSSNVPMSALKIQDLFDKAGFPKGVYTNVFVSSSLSEHIISNPKITGVNLTGSEWAGSAVGALAGKYLKPSVLELGGNDAFVVADTDDIDTIVERAVSGRMRNCGQACNASKRFIVMEKHYDEFCEKFAAKMWELEYGDPMDLQTQLGPVSTENALNDLRDQVARAIDSWAKLLVGWNEKSSSEKGFYYPATVLADVTPEVSSFHEELFGPVASVIKSKDIEDSIRLANMSDFGLSATVHGDDEEQLRSIARRLTWGMIFINSIAGSKAALPFGGVKKSGYGKENGPEWLKAFTNKKVVIY